MFCNFQTEFCALIFVGKRFSGGDHVSRFLGLDSVVLRCFLAVWRRQRIRSHLLSPPHRQTIFAAVQSGLGQLCTDKKPLPGPARKLLAGQALSNRGE
jgi:hypothetical protein